MKPAAAAISALAAKPHQRIAVAVFRQQPGSIGTQPEEGGMAQRDDAGIAKDQIQRERKQGSDGDLREQ